ncbi:MAG: tripartite tricarboxylate transporter substrate-binding protein [Chloroflexota bacterium]|nr:tripartite tricarboxylate transporter substrate-binding protein [Chloroflexota bacterium]
MRDQLRVRGAALLGALVVVASACGGGGAGTPAASASGGGTVAMIQPTKPVEFVISTAPGGGSDIYARFMQGVIEKQKLSPQPVQPTNKEGGSGAVAFQYVFEKKGDMHYIMITLNSFFTTLITQKLPYKATDFTPVANLALDPFYLWVNEDSSWKTAADFVKAAQDKELVVAGTGSKQEDEALFRRIQDTAKTKTFKYVPQSGGSTVAAALAGHQGGVEATVNNPSEGVGLYQTTPRKVRPLCAFTPDSPSDGPFKGLATCKSQGLDITDYYIMRAVMASPGLSAGQRAFWVDVFRKVYDSADWQKFMTDNALDPQFKAGADFEKFIADYQKLHEDIAKKNNWVQ